MKVLLDMNLSEVWVDFLAKHGFEVVHWSTIGHVESLDEQILDYAAEHGFVILTQDLDFGEMLALRRLTLPSIVQIRATDLRPASIGSETALALRERQIELDGGALITITPRRTRIRLLPIE